MGVHTPFPPHRRASIEGEIELHLQRVDLLLARLDRADAPFEDLEVTGAEDDFMHHAWDGPGCPIADPGEDEHDREQVNEDGSGLLSPLAPVYAVDQSLGPLNERAGYRAWQLAPR
jgi:hypothetical protein